MLIKETETIKIVSPSVITDYMQKILMSEDVVDQEKEHIWVIGVNNANVVKYIDLVSLGSATASIAHPRETFRLAVMQGVCSIILVHNHPSNTLKPSEQDNALCIRIKEAGEILGIKLLDSIIIANEGGYYSTAEQGYILQS
ncbi:MAG: JAB domain-containing protein [Candidatus Anammoxibacter sp.]